MLVLAYPRSPLPYPSVDFTLPPLGDSLGGELHAAVVRAVLGAFTPLLHTAGAVTLEG